VIAVADPLALQVLSELVCHEVSDYFAVDEERKRDVYVRRVCVQQPTDDFPATDAFELAA